MKVPQYVKLMKDGKYEFCSDHPIDDGKTVVVFDCKHSEKPLHESALCKKPTRTEYVKVTESIFDLKEEFEKGRLFHNECVIRSATALAECYAKDNIYRRIEKEVDWSEDVNNYFFETKWLGIDCSLEESITQSNYREEFLEMCRVALRATGEL